MPYLCPAVLKIIEVGCLIGTLLTVVSIMHRQTGQSIQDLSNWLSLSETGVFTLGCMGKPQSVPAACNLATCGGIGLKN